jgi:DNA-binding NtrC family response regulator
MLTDTISTDGKSSTTDISSTRRKILIVDDDIDLTSMFEVDTYNDPLLALQHFKPNSYGMALFDIRMPELNGFELYKKIHEKDDRIKVCFITAFEDYNDEFKQSFPELEETKCFVRKPKAVEDLVKHVATILG